MVPAAAVVGAGVLISGDKAKTVKGRRCSCACSRRGHADALRSQRGLPAINMFAVSWEGGNRRADDSDAGRQIQGRSSGRAGVVIATVAPSHRLPGNAGNGRDRTDQRKVMALLVPLTSVTVTLTGPTGAGKAGECGGDRSRGGDYAVAILAAVTEVTPARLVPVRVTTVVAGPGRRSAAGQRRQGVKIPALVPPGWLP